MKAKCTYLTAVLFATLIGLPASSLELAGRLIEHDNQLYLQYEENSKSHEILVPNSFLEFSGQKVWADGYMKNDIFHIDRIISEKNLLVVSAVLIESQNERKTRSDRDGYWQVVDIRGVFFNDPSTRNLMPVDLKRELYAKPLNFETFKRVNEGTPLAFRGHFEAPDLFVIYDVYDVAEILALPKPERPKLTVIAGNPDCQRAVGKSKTKLRVIK